MAARFVLQPNGKFARFSTVVDNFTDFDMTREEAINLAVKLSAEEARRQANRDLNRAEVEPRWEESCATIEAVHGADERRAVEGEINP